MSLFCNLLNTHLLYDQIDLFENVIKYLGIDVCKWSQQLHFERENMG